MERFSFRYEPIRASRVTAWDVAAERHATSIGNHLRDLLLGVNPLNIEVIWDRLFAYTSFYGRRGVAIQALSGIDLALWDIAVKQRRCERFNASWAVPR